MSGVVDQDIDFSSRLGQLPDLSRIAKIRRQEACFAPGRLYFLHSLSAAPGVTPVHDHLETVHRKFHGHRTADVGCPAGHECFRDGISALLRTSAMSLPSRRPGLSALGGIRSIAPG